MQRRERADGGRISRCLTRLGSVRVTNLYRECLNRRRSLRSWRPDVNTTGHD
jgi:hypothetical protein